jgi:SAM-dependent methyltransferase
MADLNYSIQYKIWHDGTLENDRKYVNFYVKFFRTMLADIPRNAMIIDVGCGTGELLTALQHLGFTQLCGVERDQYQYNLCCERNLQVTLTQNTEAYLKEHAGAYDVVFLMDVLEHIPVSSQVGFLEAIFAALRPGGIAYIQVPNACAPFASYFRYDDFTHYSLFTYHSLRFLCLNLGFEEPVLMNKVFLPSWRGLLYWLATFWRYESRMGLRRYWFQKFWGRSFFAEFYLSEKDKPFFTFTPNLFVSVKKPDING